MPIFSVFPPACPIPTAYRVGSAADGIQCSEQTHPSAAPPFKTGFHFSACRVSASRRIWNWAKARNGVQNVRWFVDGSDRWFVDGSDFWVSAPSLMKLTPEGFPPSGDFHIRRDPGPSSVSCGILFVRRWLDAYS